MFFFLLLYLVFYSFSPFLLSLNSVSRSLPIFHSFFLSFSSPPLPPTLCLFLSSPYSISLPLPPLPLLTHSQSISLYPLIPLPPLSPSQPRPRQPLLRRPTTSTSTRTSASSTATWCPPRSWTASTRSPTASTSARECRRRSDRRPR